ncbi:MAG TPA: LysR family transcriptional regulator [Umezawaea sp.]|nr:LysR family transcriptional regulator [Umezawaea sp.]
MTPELRQFRYFLAVAEELSFTRAAARLRIAQQSLSQQVAALERVLGARLFDRDTRGTRLTAVGALFVPEARAVVERADQAVAAVARAVRGETGGVRLAFLTTAANHLLPAVVRAAREHLPDVELTTEETTIAPLVDGVLNGRFDLGFARTPRVPGLATRTVVTEPVCAVLPVGHPLADRAEVRLSDLAAERWVLTSPNSWEPWHRVYAEHFEAAGFTPNVVRRASSVQGLLGLVAAGVGITRLALSSRDLRRTGVVFVPMTGETTDTEVVWSPDNANPAALRLLDVVTDLAATTDLTATG